jgi:hypothetical protein
VVRCAETSTAAPPCSEITARKRFSRFSPSCSAEVTNDSRGPNQITLTPRPSITVDGAVGMAGVACHVSAGQLP